MKKLEKLITGQGEDYTTRCLLDYDYIKKNYRLISIDLSWQKELDAGPKAIQIEFVGELRKLGNNDNADNDKSMFVLKFLDKIKELD